MRRRYHLSLLRRRAREARLVPFAPKVSPTPTTQREVDALASIMRKAGFSEEQVQERIRAWESSIRRTEAE